MAEKEPQYNGPVMLCATRAMTKPAYRISSISVITLPRPISLRSALAVGVGAVIGFLLSTIIGGFQAALYGIAFGGALGWLALNYEPIPGQNAFQWLALFSDNARKASETQGIVAYTAVGTARIVPQVGYYTIKRGSVPIPYGTRDERGVLISEKNKNLPPIVIDSPIKRMR